MGKAKARGLCRGSGVTARAMLFQLPVGRMVVIIVVTALAPAFVLRRGLPFLRAAVFNRTRLRRAGFPLLLGLWWPVIPVHRPLVPLLPRRRPLHSLIGLRLPFHLPVGLCLLRSGPFHSLVGPFLLRSVVLRTPLNRRR